jgi:hypothetical protein
MGHLPSTRRRKRLITELANQDPVRWCFDDSLGGGQVLDDVAGLKLPSMC